MADQASRRRLRANATPVSTRRTVLHPAVSRGGRISPRRPERGSLEAAERKHPAVFILEIALRTATDAARTAGKRKCRRTLAPIARGKQSGKRERLLRPRRHAGTETCLETGEDRAGRRPAGPRLRTCEER